MRITVAAIGRERRGPIRELSDDYCRRCPWPVQLVEVAPRSALPVERRLEDEAKRLLKPLVSDAVVIALDERGRDLTSPQFAGLLGSWRESGRVDFGFLIGGPDGLAATALRRADETVAFGRMTWPHRLVRVMLLEQIYRAATILSDHPYHRE